jgi:PAN domain.
MLAVIISILIVVVIIIVVAVLTSGSSQSDQDAQAPVGKFVWRRYYDTNFVHGDLSTPRQGTPDDRVVFAGDTTKTEQCQAWCEQDPKCLGYTHVGNTGTSWANQCYLLRSHGHGVATGSKNHQSGWKYSV